jgi:hypothetical protein
VKATKESISTIKNVAKLFVKYWPEELAYSIIKKYFLEQTTADYLAICPDDLVVGDYHYLKLVETIEKYGKENMPTLSGVCNIHNIPGYITELAICVDRPISPERRSRYYKWSNLRHVDFRKLIEGKDRIQVKFTGFPFMFIRRDVVEKIGLDSDLSYNPYHRVREGYSIDVVFCHKANEEGIPLYVNPWVQMLHLRGSKNKEYPMMENIKVYQEHPKVYLQYEDESIPQEDVTAMFNDELVTYNALVSTRSQERIVPNPSIPGRMMVNPNAARNRQYESAVIRQNARNSRSN